MAVEKLNQQQLNQTLAELNQELDNPWTVNDGLLYKRFEFANFVQAFGFITQVAMIAQRQNHHPDLHNSYKTVEYFLSTHKCGGISELDFTLAKAIEELV